MSVKSGCKNKVVSNEIVSIQSNNNQFNNTVYTLSEPLSSVDEAVIRGSVIKAYDLIEKNVISGFNETTTCFFISNAFFQLSLSVA